MNGNEDSPELESAEDFALTDSEGVPLVPSFQRKSSRTDSLVPILVWGIVWLATTAFILSRLYRAFMDPAATSFESNLNAGIALATVMVVMIVFFKSTENSGSDNQ
jgi:TctA family transporter